jgi:hypothetical protein
MFENILLSQPAVTGHIRRLEANLETTLSVRPNRFPSTTPHLMKTKSKQYSQRHQQVEINAT